MLPSAHKSFDKCPLFSELTPELYSEAFDFFNAHEASFKKGEHINTIGESLGFFALVLDGCVQIYTVDIDGEQMIMAAVESGETFGESLNFLGTDAPICVYALTDVTLLMMDTSKIKHSAHYSENELLFIRRYICLLAGRTLSLNNRIQIMSKLTLRAKLTAFFTECVNEYKSSEFEVPFDRENMAVYLGCDRSSLSRELAKMKSEGLINYEKNSFWLLKKSEST